MSGEKEPLTKATNSDDSSIAIDEDPSVTEAESTESTLQWLNNWLRKISNACNDFFQYTFFHIGMFCAHRPVTVMLATTLIAALCALGCLKFEIENLPQNLWIPAGSVVLEQAAFVGALYTSDPRINYFIAEPLNDPRNILTPENLQAAMSLHLQVAAIKVVAPDADGVEETWDLASLCVLQPGTSQCEIDSILSLWNYDLDTLINDANPLATVNQQNNVDPTSILRQLGDISVDSTTGQILAARALKNVYEIENRGVLVDNSVVDLPAETWELAFLNLTRDSNPTLYIYPEAERSYTDEFNEAVNSDIVILLAGFGLIILYTSVVLGKFSLLRSRVALSLLGIVSIGYSIAFSFGLSSLLGFKYNYVHSVLPFLLLAVGVDNIFIIFNAYQQTDHKHTIELRTAEAMAHAGVSITVTSLTNFCAFLVGTSSSLPALSSFCVYTALAALGLYFFQITWFCSALVLDERRIAAGRLDCCCCVRRPYEKEGPVKRGIIAQFLGEYWAPFVINRFVRIGIFLATATLAGVAIWGVTQVEIKDALSSFVPEGSYVSQTQDINAEYFVDLGDPVDIITRAVDYASMENQENIENFKYVLNGTQYMQYTTSAYYDCWYDAFYTWLQTSSHQGELGAGGRPNVTSFHPWLREFLSTTEGRPYSSDVVYARDGSDLILSTRIRWSYAPLQSAPEEVEAMYTLRDKCDTLSIDSFPWTYLYLTWEQNAVVESSIYSNLLSSLLIVFVIILLLIAQPLVAILVEICVALVILEILGFMTFWNVALDSVSAVNLVLAVGLSVDYLAHIGHCFMLKQGTRGERVIAAIADIGNSVINGALSTFLAILLLAFSQSYVFIVFFKQFFLVCTLSVFHAMFFLPAILSLIGPAAYEPRPDIDLKDMASAETRKSCFSCTSCCLGPDYLQRLEEAANETRRLLDEERAMIAAREKERQELWERERQMEEERQKERELMTKLLAALERQTEAAASAV